MKDRDTGETPQLEGFEVQYTILSNFLKDAGEHLAKNQLPNRTGLRIAPASTVRLTLELPVIAQRLDLRVTNDSDEPVPASLTIDRWERGDRERLWRFVALAWTMLKAAAHPHFQSAPPAPAAIYDVRTLVQLSPPETLRSGVSGSSKAERITEAPAAQAPPSSTPMMSLFI